MKLTSFGAAQEVTGSKHLLEIKGKRILIDCGLFQGSHQGDNKKALDDLKDIDAVFLTHGHLDHSGYLPRLVKSGFHGPIFATPATKEVAKIIMLDNAKIQTYEAKKNNKDVQKEKDKIEALYQEIHVQQTLPLFQTKSWNEPFKWQGLDCLYQNAGHILGASSLRIHSDKISLVFSGDLGRYDDEIMYDPESFDQADYVVMESTYGDREHDRGLKPRQELSACVDRIKKKQSTLLIPAFSVARSQNIIFHLFQLFKREPSKKVPLYVDSKMTQQVCDLYERFVDEHRLEKEDLKEMFSYCRFVEHESQREKLHMDRGAKIILSASGMLTGGRAPEYLSLLGKERNNELLLVGYQAEGTLGREFVDGGRPNWLGEVTLAKSFSSHADKRELKKWLGKIQKVKKVFLIHGEEPALNSLAQDLSYPTQVLEKGISVELN